MNEDYLDFLASKAPRAQPSGITPGPFHEDMRRDQVIATDFALRAGRAALFLDTGLGKTFEQLEFCQQGAENSNGRALILTPLAVAKQIEREAVRFGYDARVVRSQDDVRDGINICNYDRLDKLDPAAFGCVSLDESSILKSFDGKTTRKLIEIFGRTPFRLAATATPAPNDHMELGQHAEFLGVMTQAEMLTRWFINDSHDTGQWRLKGHAQDAFWDWVASWAVMAETPADLGCDASGFDLPPLNIIRHHVAGHAAAKPGTLFATDVSATDMFRLKRQTADARAEVLGEIIAADPGHFWVIWCDTNDESAALAAAIPDAIEIRGSQSIAEKEDKLAAFANGDYPAIITKGSISGFGVNWQHADRQAFVGRSFSYETWYQCVRRSWRFGQCNPVDVHIAVAEGEDQIGRVIDRKAAGHEAMKAAMRRATARAMGRSSQTKVKYVPTEKVCLPEWLTA